MTKRTPGSERGTAVLEFAIVMVLLFTLVFGIIVYAYMMSYRQAVTQAAAEGARAGAVAPGGSEETNARLAVDRALEGYKISCSGSSLIDDDTSAVVGSCTIAGPAACSNNVSRNCIVVTVRHDYADHPLLEGFPGLGLMLPDTIEFTSVAEVS